MQKQYLRIFDANFNRYKEGLRVLEDVFRFVVEDDRARRKARQLRHALDALSTEHFFVKAILARDAKGDCGRAVDVLEATRNDVSDLVFANLQRAKESLRVLEELCKILSPSWVARVKAARYQLYTFEKDVFSRELLFKKRSNV